MSSWSLMDYPPMSRKQAKEQEKRERNRGDGTVVEWPEATCVCKKYHHSRGRWAKFCCALNAFIQMKKKTLTVTQLEGMITDEDFEEYKLLREARLKKLSVHLTQREQEIFRNGFDYDFWDRRIRPGHVYH